MAKQRFIIAKIWQSKNLFLQNMQNKMISRPNNAKAKHFIYKNIEVYC
jgi:hypothetical protein